MVLRVAAVQIPVTLDVEANVASIMWGIERASEENADILLTPEGSLSGYTHQFDEAAVSDALERVIVAAREKRVGLALGTCFVESGDGKCYNQLRFYLPNGEYLGFHSKILACCDIDNPADGEFNVYATASLRTFDFAGITIGGLICNDMWGTPGCTPVPNPHLSQQLADQGARIIFHAVNGGRDGSPWSRDVVWPYHESNLRLRARAGGVWIVTVDNCNPTHIPCSAPSGVIDPEGNWVCRAEPQGRQFFVYTIEP